MSPVVVQEMCVRKTKIFGTKGELTGDGMNGISVYDFATKRTTVRRRSPIMTHILVAPIMTHILVVSVTMSEQVFPLVCAHAHAPAHAPADGLCVA